MGKKDIIIDGENLTIEQVVSVARGGAKIKLSRDAEQKVLRGREVVRKAIDQKRVVYGITTGFGAFSDVFISEKKARLLQKNILMSHATGVGKPLEEEIVRAIMLIRINTLAKGHSGIRLKTIQTLVKMLNQGIHPVVPEKGSVGASGDLAPLAHLSLVIIGKGNAIYKGLKMTGKGAMSRGKVATLELEEGEGLALINGTQVMTGIGALTVYDSINLVKTADIAAGMSLEVLMGSNIELDQKIQKVRPHRGQTISAGNLRRITRNSGIISSHKDCSRVQDAYTLRCTPQVHGASGDALDYVKGIIDVEMNSATDNPLIFPEYDQILSGGNFHGQPVALALDFLAIALSEMANISERRTERLVNPQLSGLPAFLVKEGGLNSGFMIAQYTAAALVSENKVLSHPASVDSIPTSANKEDHVSMGTISARKCREVLFNAENVLSIELLCAAQALDLLTNLKQGKGTMEAYRTIRRNIPHLKKDRIIHKDIERMYELVHHQEILFSVEKRVGRLR